MIVIVMKRITVLSQYRTSRNEANEPVDIGSGFVAIYIDVFCVGVLYSCLDVNVKLFRNICLLFAVSSSYVRQ